MATIPADQARTLILTEILSERIRQITAEGYDAAHDDAHTFGEIGQMAASYALLGAGNFADADRVWPWDEPHTGEHTGRRAMIIAAALCLAEIERLDRAEALQLATTNKENTDG